MTARLNCCCAGTEQDTGKSTLPDEAWSCSAALAIAASSAIDNNAFRKSGRFAMLAPIVVMGASLGAPRAGCNGQMGPQKPTW
ncbi:hypothetical protein GCM10011487_42260 [Steroidobacter agaridevorans]|uniref:Uncharacterized protein n=1 Tax=Steroidobacter agaridevorans TaxID=2695856 RepID=A0A829YI80_9GAMM|nr:hypothetical protein GCM10011487_42260 [Steroidobacter agaridevorans]